MLLANTAGSPVASTNARGEAKISCRITNALLLVIRPCGADGDPLGKRAVGGGRTVLHRVIDGPLDRRPADAIRILIGSATMQRYNDWNESSACRMFTMVDAAAIM